MPIYDETPIEYRIILKDIQGNQIELPVSDVFITTNFDIEENKQITRVEGILLTNRTFKGTLIEEEITSVMSLAELLEI